MSHLPYVIIQQFLVLNPSTRPYLQRPRPTSRPPSGAQICVPATADSKSMKMASHRPFRARPNLHLTLTQQTGSPRNLNAVGPASSRYASPFSTPTASPLATTSYSPYASAKLKAPSPYGSAMHFTPRQKHKYRRHCRAVLQTIKRMLLTRTTWLLMILMLTIVWWLNGGSEELGAVKIGAAGFGKDLFQDGVTQNMQFFPPSNPKIHVRLLQSE